jgi:hypothetical protein
LAGQTAGGGKNEVEKTHRQFRLGREAILLRFNLAIGGGMVSYRQPAQKRRPCSE